MAKTVTTVRLSSDDIACAIVDYVQKIRSLPDGTKCSVVLKARIADESEITAVVEVES